MEYSYRKPVYDPFEVFKPTKAFIKEVLQQLKTRSYEILKQKRENREEDYQIFVWPHLEAEQEKLTRLIRSYEYYLRRGKPGETDSGRINEYDIGRAKSVPITNFYTTKLIKSGGRLKGRCPFHSEKTASFVIYPTNTFNCFGCQASGDVISYIQKTNNLKFIEAVRFLIQK